MADHFSSIIMSAGLMAWLGIALFLSWPRRRERQLTLRRTIAAAPERVWDIYRLDDAALDGNDFHENILSSRTIRDRPTIRETEVDTSGGHGTHVTTVQEEILAEQRPRIHAARTCAVDGEPFPFGRNNIEALELEPCAQGTLATLQWRGETASLWQFITMWRACRRVLARLSSCSETGTAARVRVGSGSLATSLALSGLAIGSFAMWLGWYGALLLTFVLLVHEFGHWLAMRLTGQPAPRVLLVPFFGGVAVANHPHRTQFDDAFCSLMGPGLSALLCLALVVTGMVIGVPDLSQGWAAPYAGATVPQMFAQIALLLALAVGALNLLQLLPVLPLDGGHVLRAVIQSFSALWARRVLLAISVSGIVGLAYWGDFILAGVLGLGALQAWYMSTEDSKARAMSGAGLTAIVLGYGLTLAIHATAVVYGIRMVGADLF